MPDIIDLGPLQPNNAVAELEARNRLEAQRESASADEIINGALLTTIPATIVRHLQRASIPADSSFELTPTMIKEASQDLDPDLAKKLIDADSQEELGIIRGQMVFEQQRRDALRRAGWVGTAATIGANVLDPVQLASGALTMGATSAGRLAGAIEAGLVNAIPQVALESYQVSEQTDRGPGDVLSTAGAVFGLGAAAELARGAGALKGALIAGAGGAIGAAAVEAPRALFDQDRSTRDLLYAVAGNFAFGSTIGALGNAGRKTQAVAELYDIAEDAGKVRGSTVDVSEALTPKGKARFQLALSEEGDTPGSRLAKRFGEKSGPLSVLTPIEQAEADMSRLLREPESELLNLLGIKGEAPPAVADGAVGVAPASTPAPARGDTLSDLLSQTNAPAPQFETKVFDPAAELRARGAAGPLADLLGLPSPSVPTPLSDILSRSEENTLGRLLSQKSPADPGYTAKTFDPTADIRRLAAGLSPSDRRAMFNQVVDLQDGNASLIRRAKEKVRQLIDGGESRTSAMDRVGRALEAGLEPESVGDAFFDGLEAFVLSGSPAASPSADSSAAASASSASAPLPTRSDHPRRGRRVPPLLGHPDNPAQDRRQDRTGQALGADRFIRLADDLASAHLEADGATIRAAATKGLTEQESVSEAMGAATQQSIYPPPQAVVPRMTGKLADDFDLGGLTDAKAAFSWRTILPFRFVAGILRWDMPGMLGGSKIDEFRALANAIAPDSLAKAGDLPTIETAPVWVQSRHNADIGTARAADDLVYQSHVDSAYKAGSKAMTPTEFWEAVSKARRRGIPAGTDPAVAKAAQDQAKRFEQYLEQTKRHKVVGADQIGAELEYVPRVPAKAKLDEAMSDQAIRRSGIIATVENAIRAKQPNLSPQKVSEIAEDWVTNFQDDSVFSADHFSPPKPGEPWTPRLKRRVEMDETLRTTLPSGKTLAVEDLLENHAQVLEGMYNLSLLHASARQEVFRAMSARLGKDIGSTDTLLKALEDHAKDLGVPKAEYESDLKKLEHLMRHAVEGLPTTDYNAPAVRTMRLVRDLNFFKLLSGVGTGIQNITEIVPALSQAGGRAAFRQLPAFEAALRAQIAGQATDDLTIALHAMTGVGMDRTLRRILPRATDADTPGANFTANRAERAVKRLTRFAGDVSLQNHGQQWMQDVTGAVVLQRWLDDTLKDRVRTQRYYAGLGITPDEARRIEQQIKAHAVTTKTWAGTKIVDPNYRAWGDQEAAAKFRYTVTREVNRLVLTNNPAAYSKWMTTETGKMIAQFRTFAFGAWTNKVLYGVQQRDMRTWISVVLGFATSAAGYTLARLQDSVGKPDAEEYRAKMLSPEAIATAAFGRSAYSSLIPGTVDAVAGGILGRDPIFSHARSSGLASGGLKSIPIVDYGDRLARAVGSIQAPFTEDYYFSQQDLRNLEEALFVPRLVGLRNVIEQLGSSLPESSRE